MFSILPVLYNNNSLDLNSIVMDLAVQSLQSQINYEGAKEYMEKLLFQIYEHFNDKLFIDVTFELSNPTALVPAHRLILSSASPFFKALFSGVEDLHPQIVIADIDSVTFKCLIIFCYTGQIALNMDNVDTMLKAAVVLQLDDAVSKCADFIIDNIPYYPLQRLYALNSEQKTSVLDQKILEYEIKNFMDIIQSGEFLNFDFIKLQKLIENDDLNVDSERDVFEVVKRWYEYDAIAREPHILDLISCLRLTQFKRYFIMTNIHTLPGCQSLALEASAWNDKPSDHTNLKLKYTKPRKGEEKLLFALNLEKTAIDDYGNDDGFRAIFQYEENSWTKFDDFEIDLRDFEVIFKDDSLFFIGGSPDRETSTNQVCSWSLKTRMFKKLPPMNEPRSSHALAILYNKIYAIGGCSSAGTLQSVEMYSAINGWKFVKSMITPRSEAAAVAYNGKLYVIGGNEESEFESVECFDPLTDSWTQCANMIGVHEHLAATVHKGYIFVVCANNDEITAIVERYDPQKNEWTEFWSNAESFETLKTSCASFQNRLWACWDIEIYEIETHELRIAAYSQENNLWQDIKAYPYIPGIYIFFTVPKILFTNEEPDISLHIAHLDLNSDKLNKHNVQKLEKLASSPICANGIFNF